MKQFFKFFFASLLAMVVAGVLFFVVFFAVVGYISTSVSEQFSSDPAVITRDNSILYIDLRSAYPELGETNALAMFTGGPARKPGLYTVLEGIHHAKKDPKIKGIFLKAGGNQMGIATAQQIREALKDFKTGGKFIYTYGDFISQSNYFLASVSDSIFVNPLGGLELKGLASNLVFFKGALDKLEVKPEIFYCGQFKSATEPFRMEKMSEPNRKQLAAMQEDIWNTYLSAFGEHAQTDPDTLNQWAQRGSIQTAYDALTHHLIDGLRYKDQVEILLRKQSGLNPDDKIRFTDIADYARFLPSPTGDQKIALLIAEGEIVDGSSGTGSTDHLIASEDFIKEIRKIRDNDNIKAVVMRVNSPGGSALASEVILRELSLLKKKKPLVVSMGDVAASGGYYISCQADSIFALPTTITGSIGVFGMMFNTQAFFNNKLGVTFDSEKNAPYADMPSANRPMTPQEKTFIQNGVDSIYLTFKSRVASGRNKSANYIDSIGQGRIWSGTAAVGNGLIDAIGGLNRAFESAASLAKIQSYAVETFPASVGKFDRFFRSMKEDGVDEKILAEQLLQRELGSDYHWFSILKKMQEQKNHIWMLMPFIPEIK
jgi:protease-4